MMMRACFISFFFFFAGGRAVCVWFFAPKKGPRSFVFDRRKEAEREREKKKETKGTLFPSSSFISFCTGVTTYHQSDDVYLFFFFCFSRHHDYDNDHDEKRAEEEKMVFAQSEFVR